MKEIKDRFSSLSDGYRKFRPVYPTELYNYLFSFCAKTYTAWDCGTGNGQVASVLSAHFNAVEASDISEKQMQQAPVLTNVRYTLQRAEATDFKDGSFDLITVVQALHWFDVELFFKEAERLLTPAGVLAVWGYGLLRISDEIDPLIDSFYKDVIGAYWDDERKHIDNQYENMPFPANGTENNNRFSITVSWNLEQLRGYFNSWSGVQNYSKHRGNNPVDLLMVQLAEVWGEPEREVRFPLFVKIVRFNIKKSH